jgi:hypothetical protein
LEKNKLDLGPEDLEISCDIDSVIWVTRNLVAKSAINIHLALYRKDRPSFASNPSVYTDLLKPPRDDWEKNHPHLQDAVAFPLSSIPHIPFGHFGEG